ncbi:MAG: ATPase [Campylobacteraceae bacterium 4484_166]|nr:MAG: ATPase [Campylobacteraceae bacterium 4484_166]
MRIVEKIKEEIQKVIIGHDELIEGMIVALLSDGHILVQGVPGVAKTTAVKSLANVMNLQFKRVQFTPDLLPSDITGNEILDIKNNEFKLKKGPIFTSLLLADEINRAGAKVQSALLEAMAENQVTIGEHTIKLEKPFMVLATSNPVEQDGTYELPEASLDRFMLKLKVQYNTIDEEFDIINRVVKKDFEEVNAIINKSDIETIKNEIANIHIDDELIKYITKLIFATREPHNYGLDDIAKYIEFGASPRGSINLFKTSKTYAYLQNSQFVTPYHITKMAYMVLRHRIRLSYEATIDEIDTDDIIKKIIKAVPTP